MFIGLIFVIVLAVVAADNSDRLYCDGGVNEYGETVEPSEDIDDKEYCKQVEKIAILAGIQIVSFLSQQIINSISCARRLSF